MGIGFVLFIWLFFWLFIALIFGLVLAVRSYRRKKETSPSTRLWASFKTFLIPFAVVFYLFFAFILYALWCQFVRGVDPGIGDGFQVAVGNGYSYMAIDLPSNAYIETPTGEQIGRLLSIGREGEFVFGKVSGEESYFIINTASRTIVFLSSEQALHEECQRIGIARSGMQSPEAFYYNHRWSIVDLLAVVVIISPLGVFFVVWRRRKNKSSGL